MNHDHLYGTQHNCRIHVLKLGHHSFTDMFTLLLVICPISRQGGEDGNTTPFRTFVQSDKEFGKGSGVNDEKGLIGTDTARRFIVIWRAGLRRRKVKRSLVNVPECGNGICNNLSIDQTSSYAHHCMTYHRITIADKISQSFNEPVFDSQLWLQIKHFGDTQSSSLSDVGVLIFEASR